MDNDAKKHLTGILDAFAAKQAAWKREVERKKSEHELFLERFADKVKSVIRPAMEGVSAELRSRGHETSITERQEAVTADGRVTEANIDMAIMPSGQTYPMNRRDPLSCPHITFIAGHHENKVSVYESTMMPGGGGQSGRTREYTLDQVTAEVVQSHILKVLAEAMGK